MDNTKDPPKSRGYGFVRFYDPKDSKKAVKLYDGVRLGGRTLRVTPSQADAALLEAEKNSQVCVCVCVCVCMHVCTLRVTPSQADAALLEAEKNSKVCVYVCVCVCVYVCMYAHCA